MSGSTDRPAVDVSGLGYTFPGRERPTLHDISFSLPAGSWTVVAGRTGSGKSTLLRALVGLIPHLAGGRMSGVVRLFDNDTRRLSIADLARTVGFVQQSPDDQIATNTVEAELAFGLENLNLPIAEIATRIDEFAARFGLRDHLNRPTPYLSGGMKQRLVLAAALAMRPQVLVCDEPLSQLDAASTGELLCTLRQLRDAGLTIVTAEHRLSEVLPHADRLLVLDDGRIVDDRPASSGQDIAPDAAPRLRTGRQSHPGIVVARADRLTFAYPQGKPIWSDVSFTLARGERVAVVGPNGAGKSTLLSVLAGLLEPLRGRLLWHGSSSQLPASLVPQRADLTLFNRTVEAELAFGPRQIGLSSNAVAERVATAAERFHVVDSLDEPPQALSQGQRVRTAIAAAWATAPRLLLLDEPTTGQDVATMRSIMASLTAGIGEPGGPETLVFSTHDLPTAVTFADRIWVLGDDRLLADVTPEQLLNDGELLRRAALQSSTESGPSQARAR